MQTRTPAAVIYCRVKREETPKHGRDGPEEDAEEMRSEREGGGELEEGGGLTQWPRRVEGFDKSYIRSSIHLLLTAADSSSGK